VHVMRPKGPGVHVAAQGKASQMCYTMRDLPVCVNSWFVCEVRYATN
jgi:hypothetical protein